MQVTHGLVFGKFYPPHRGHKFLIDTALQVCDRVTVLVLAHPVEAIAARQRASWIREIHQDHADRLSVLFTTTDQATDYDPANDGVWQAWTKIIEEMVYSQYKVTPLTHLFTSEDYGDEQAKRLSGNVEHVKLDMGRHSFPLSATAVRANPVRHWWNLEAPVRAGLTKRVVLVGAESTGKSTLARNLGTHYDTPVVSEYGRERDIVKRATGDTEWTKTDFKVIQIMQNVEEERLARQAGPVLICDTDNLATAVWYERYMEREPWEEGLDLAKARIEADIYAHYILTDDANTPYVNDGSRFDDGSRPWMTARFKELLDEFVGPRGYTVISGSWEDRYDQAVHAIDKVLWDGWDLPMPIDTVKEG